MIFLNPAAFLLLLQLLAILFLALALLLFLPDVAIRRLRGRKGVGWDVTGRRGGQSSGAAASIVPAAAWFGGRGRRA